MGGGEGGGAVEFHRRPCNNDQVNEKVKIVQVFKVNFLCNFNKGGFYIFFNVIVRLMKDQGVKIPAER